MPSAARTSRPRSDPGPDPPPGQAAGSARPQPSAATVPPSPCATRSPRRPRGERQGRRDGPRARPPHRHPILVNDRRRRPPYLDYEEMGNRDRPPASAPPVESSTNPAGAGRVLRPGAGLPRTGVPVGREGRTTEDRASGRRGTHWPGPGLKSGRSGSGHPPATREQGQTRSAGKTVAGDRHRATQRPREHRVDDYRLLPRTSSKGGGCSMTTTRTARFSSADPIFDGRRHKAVVEQTSNDELFLTTFHRLRSSTAGGAEDSRIGWRTVGPANKTPHSAPFPKERATACGLTPCRVRRTRA